MGKDYYTVGYDSATGADFEDTGYCAQCWHFHCLGKVGWCEYERHCARRGVAAPLTPEQEARRVARNAAREACERAEARHRN